MKGDAKSKMITYMLKHQDRDVASFVLDSDGDLYTFEILNSDEMPILGNGRKSLAEWIQNRAIPDSRKDLDEILQQAGCKTAQEYMIHNLALSLSDSYWICPIDERNLKWEDLNLYQHPTGDLTFQNRLNELSHKKVRNNSSLTGSLEKYNSYEKDGWHLIKKGDHRIPAGIQNINEAFVSMLHERQGFSDYTRYILNFDEYGICESCDCKYFTDKDHELLSAYNVTGGITGRAETPKDAYKEYIDICIANGLNRDYVVHFMDYMLMTDFLITNTDRHWENFGILRDPNTLKFLSLAPIFDSGTSMQCNDPFATTRLQLLKTDVNGICKHQEENLELVQDKHVVNISKLPSIKEVINFYTQRGIQKERAEQIAQCFDLKKDMLIEFQHGFSVSVQKEYEYNGIPPYKNGIPNKEYKADRDHIHFVVVCGIPDSGKEEIGKSFIQDDAKTVYVRTNNIRERIGLIFDEDENRVFDTAYKQIQQALKDRKDVVYVATNLDRETRKRVLKLADNIPGVEKILSVVYADPLKVHSNIPKQRLVKMAEILRDNKPDISEGWDNIEVFGNESRHIGAETHNLESKYDAR